METWRGLVLVLGVLAAFLVPGCAGEGIVDPISSGPLCTDVTPFRPELHCIQQIVLTPTCAISGCHRAPGAQEGLQLTSGDAYAHLIGVPSNQAVPQMDRVVPGDPDNSYLIVKLKGTDPRLAGDQMPLGGPSLSQAEINVIREWILNGAMDD